MNASEDLVCEWCGAEVVWENDGPDILGMVGEDIAVGCVNPRCDAKEGSWSPVPRSSYRP